MTSISNLFQSAFKAKLAGPEMAKLRKATEDFEAVLLKDVFARMRESGMNTETKSHAMTILRDMSDQAFAENASKNGDFGVGKRLYTDIAPMALRQAYAKASAELNHLTSDNQGTKV